jgi:hypothetical protein
MFMNAALRVSGDLLAFRRGLIPESLVSPSASAILQEIDVAAFITERSFFHNRDVSLTVAVLAPFITSGDKKSVLVNPIFVSIGDGRFIQMFNAMVRDIRFDGIREYNFLAPGGARACLLREGKNILLTPIDHPQFGFSLRPVTDNAIKGATFYAFPGDQESK